VILQRRCRDGLCHGKTGMALVQGWWGGRGSSRAVRMWIGGVVCRVRAMAKEMATLVLLRLVQERLGCSRVHEGRGTEHQKSVCCCRVGRVPVSSKMVRMRLMMHAMVLLLLVVLGLLLG